MASAINTVNKAEFKVEMVGSFKKFRHIFLITFYKNMYKRNNILKSALSGLRQFLVTENPLKIMKNNYFTLKALFILKIFKFLY